MDLNNMTPAVRAALTRRGMGSPVPQLQQVTPNSQTVNAPVAPNPIPQSAMTKSSAMPSQPKAPSQKFQPQNQQDMLVMSLVEQMKNNNKLEQQKLKVAQGQSIQPPQPSAPQLSFNQPPAQNSGNVFGSPTTTATANMQGGNPFGQSPF